MRKLLLLMSAGLWVIVLSAQLPPLLTLEDCIHRAEQNSYRLQSDTYIISATAEQASLSKSQRIPRIDGDLTMENQFLQPYYFNQIWASVHADWSLGDLIQKTGRSVLQDVETQKLKKEQNRLDVVGRSTSLYASVLQVKKQIELLVVRMGFLQRHHALTQGMWKAGIRTRLDVLQTESELVKLQEDTARLAIVRKNLRNELALLLGWQNTDSLRLAPLRLAAITELPLPHASIESLSDNPLIASFDSKVKAQQFRTNEMTAGQLPHFLLGGGYFVDGDPTAIGNYWRIDAGIRIPIYYGHEIAFKKQVSEEMTQSYVAQKKEVERETLIHLAKVYERLVKLKGILDLQSQRQSITQQAVNFAEINYKAGISTNLDYLLAQQRLTNTQLSIEETRLQYTMNLIEFYVTTNQVDQIIALEYE